MPPQPVLTPSSASPLPVLPSVSLLPFSLPPHLSGPAPISRFFRPRPYPFNTSSTPSEPTPAHRQAAFRGRRVVSSLLPLPKGYTGVVLSSVLSAAPPSASTAAQTDLADEDAEEKEEREERAAKRAKRAVEAAAAFTSEQGDDEGEGAGLRRSPRKTRGGAAAGEKRARERAVEKARREAAEKKKKGKGKAKGKGFSLDSDDDEEKQEEDEQVVEEKVEAEEEKKEGEETVEMQIDDPKEEVVAVEATLPPPPLAPATESEESQPGANEDVEEPLQIAAVDSTSSLPSPSEPAPSVVPSLAPLASSSSLLATPLPSTTTSFFPAQQQQQQLQEEESSSTVLLPLRPLATFTAFEVWNADFPIAGGRVGEEDEVGRVVSEWVGVAEAVRFSSSRPFFNPSA